MRVHEVHLSQRTQKFLEKLDEHIRIRIKSALKKLKDNPIPSDAKFITREGDDKVFRYRIGDYRALYNVKERDEILLVTKIDKRPRVYHR
ncbi:MAG: type II toxin-antitoxin system RelE family toxin [Candidatus Woesearchaeota archaeon]